MSAASEDNVPRVPTADGLNLVKPNAVNGIKISHEFFIVSTNMSLWQYMRAYKCFILALKSKLLTESPNNSEGLRNVVLFNSKICKISYKSLAKLAIIDISQNLFAVRVHLSESVLRKPLLVSHTI